MLNDVAVATLDPRRFQAVLGQVTKRVHNLLHGQPGDHDALGDPDRAVYEQTLAEAFEELRRLVDRAVATLLGDRDRAARMGAEAHRRVLERYLAPRRLAQELDLVERVAA